MKKTNEEMLEEGWFGLLKTRVVGLQHHAAKGKPLEVGEHLVLHREENNPHDPNAVGAWRGSDMVGYLPMESNMIPMRILRAGYDLVATVQEAEAYTASVVVWMRKQG